MVLRNQAVENNVAAFSEFYFAVRWQGRLSGGQVNYSSDGGQSCPKGRRVYAKSGSLSIVCARLGPRKLSVIRSSGVSTVQGQGLLKY